MRTPMIAAGLAGLMLAIGACSNSRTEPAPRSESSASMNDYYEVPPPRTSVPAVMQAKLAHAQAVLEGITLGDFAQVEVNARDLRRISLGSEWLVHESPAYVAFSEEFRRVCDDLINHARARKIEQTAEDYSNLTQSCVACHTYLRNERQFRDMPGRVTMSQ